MAGEITQQAILLALGGAGIGASGAVGAQIVAAIFTGKREKKQAEDTEERWKREAEAKRRDRSLDHKTALFVKFFATMEDVHRFESPSAVLDHDTIRTRFAEMRPVIEAVEEIGLIAPEIYRYVQKTSKLMTDYIFTKLGWGHPQKNSPSHLLAIKQEHALVGGWIHLTRAAVRSYIAHEQVIWPEQAIAELNEKIRLMKLAPYASANVDMDEGLTI
ncbi:hypothetical protein ABIB48_002643 [Arthrobacter sp. UYCu511]|uniref:hypothetical protein n=1 Tax=Arthrobacter sp. UYCu511 TaxID=3156337 RepID=UPI0033973681